MLSSTFAIQAGVRQGGLLSPALFAVYMDVLINKLKISGYGCKIHGDFFGCFAYADDIILISHSVIAMQHMLNICDEFAIELDVKFNVIKSVAMRIGLRFKVKCSPLRLAGNYLEFVESLKYLRVYITAHNYFKCSFDHVKHKFYKTFNSIYCKSKAAGSELVSVELFRSYCLPLMLYACEASFPNKRDIQALNNCVNLAVMKIFGLTSRDNIVITRNACSLANLGELIMKRRLKMMFNLLTIPLFTHLIKITYSDFI